MEASTLYHLTQPANSNHQQPVSEKFSSSQLLMQFDRTLLQRIESSYKNGKEGMDLLEFTRFFMNCFDHSPHNSLELAAGLRELFECMAKGAQKVRFSDITDYVCQNITGGHFQNQLQTRWLPPCSQQVCLNDPPVINGGRTEEIGKVSAGGMSLDKLKHDNFIGQACYSASSGKIYCLELMADWIGVYNQQIKLEQRIQPSNFKAKKDAAVLGIAFSQREERLGAILKDYSINFWDVCDGYSFQKSIPTAHHCKQLQCSIWYLQRCRKWVTADAGGNVYFWNLLSEQPERSFMCRHKAKVNDICEIVGLDMLAVVQEYKHISKIQNLSVADACQQISSACSTPLDKQIKLNDFSLLEKPVDTQINQKSVQTPENLQINSTERDKNIPKPTNIYDYFQEMLVKYRKSSLILENISDQFLQKKLVQPRKPRNKPTTIQLFNINSGEIIMQIQTKLQRRVLHTIKYSEEYQVLLSAGYQKIISLFEINGEYLEYSLKGELTGHESAVSCMTLVPKTPMAVSADDKGKVKIWNIKNFKCMQTIDYTDKVVITKVLDMSQHRKIAVMGSRITLLHLQEAPENLPVVTPLQARLNGNCLQVVTRHDVRHYYLHDGKLHQIECNYHQKQISAFLMLEKGQVVTGNDQGELLFYPPHSTNPSQTQLWHSSPVQHLQEDTINGLIVSFSQKSGFVVAQKNVDGWQQLRSLKGFQNKEISAITLSSYHNILGFVCSQSVFTFSYDQLKLLHQINFNTEESPTCLSITNGIPVMVVATNHSTFHIYSFTHKALTHLQSVSAGLSQVTHLKIDLSCNIKREQINWHDCKIVAGLQNGHIGIIDIKSIVQKVTFSHNSTKSNFQRQIKEQFETQLKKAAHHILEMQFKIAQKIQYSNEMNGHSGGITSIMVAQLNQHLLITTGHDHRLKIWKNYDLIADTNINLPLPYKWELSTQKPICRPHKKIKGAQLIQAVYKRYGNDITLSEAKLFKFTKYSENVSNQIFCNSSSPFKSSVTFNKKPTLFQQKFSVVDLNYDKIKKQKIMPTSGPTLHQMEIQKKIESMQLQWKKSKDSQDLQRNNVFMTIQNRAQKNEEKQNLMMLLKSRHHLQPRHTASTPQIRQLQQKLEDYINHKCFQKNQQMTTSSFRKTDQVVTKPVFKRNISGDKRSEKTLQSYFCEKFASSSTATSWLRSSVQSATCSPRPSTESKSISSLHKENNSFRFMLKQMREKLSKSKKLERKAIKRETKQVQTSQHQLKRIIKSKHMKKNNQVFHNDFVIQ